jgi:hypothetical protein
MDPEIDHGSRDENDAVVELLLRRVTTRGTVRSFKETINTYALIRAVRRSGSARDSGRRWRWKTPAALLAMTLSAVVTHWHLWHLLTIIAR